MLPYWKITDDLYADGDLVVFGTGLAIPSIIRRRTLARLHDRHRGVKATKRRARQTVLWPGINSDITSTLNSCKQCQILQFSQQKDPYMCDNHPTRPFESVSAYFFIVEGKSFLVIVDRLSQCGPCRRDTTISTTIRSFCNCFKEVGVTPLSAN